MASTLPLSPIYITRPILTWNLVCGYGVYLSGISDDGP